LISLVDADQKVGEVEFSDLGGLKESLSELSDHLSGNLSFVWVLNNHEGWLWNGLDLGLGGDLEDFTHDLSELEVLLSLEGLDSFSCLLHDGVVVNEEVFIHNLEVLGWVNSNVHGLVKLLEVEVFGFNGSLKMAAIWRKID
jgi:hypothetical protein